MSTPNSDQTASELPHVTVAAVVPRGDRFLMVRERSAGLEVINQPAGHLENDETLLEAVVRETLEETRWRVEPVAVLGLYHYFSTSNHITYVRVCFLAEPVEEISNATLDPDIIEPLWLTGEDIRQYSGKLRSPIVAAAVDDYQRGIRYPLSLICEPWCYD